MAEALDVIEHYRVFLLHAKEFFVQQPISISQYMDQEMIPYLDSVSSFRKQVSGEPANRFADRYRGPYGEGKAQDFVAGCLAGSFGGFGWRVCSAS